MNSPIAPPRPDFAPGASVTRATNPTDRHEVVRYRRCMPLAAFKDLCLAAVDRDAGFRFWSAVLGGSDEVPNDAVARVSDRRLHVLWINTVREPKVVKNRVLLD